MPPLGISRILDSFDRRLHRLEHRRPKGVCCDSQVVFSKAGAVDSSISGRWSATQAVMLKSMIVHLNTPPSGSSVEVYVSLSGSEIGSLTIPSGSRKGVYSGSLDAVVGTNQYVQVGSIVSGGATAADMTVILSYICEFEIPQGSA